MYRRIVRSLIYMTITWPDLSYVVVVVSQFMQTLQKPHLDGVKCILRYLKQTLQCGIFYEAKSQLQVHGYTDADWVGNVLDRRLTSTSGFMFSFGSGVISWSSKKQPTITLSSMEAKYTCAAITTCEIVWLQKLFSDLGQLVDAPIVIYCDNISSILLANNPVLSWPRIFWDTLGNVMSQDILGYFWQYHGLGYFGILGILLAMSYPRIFWDTFDNIMAQDILKYFWQYHGLGYFGTSMVQGYKRRQSGEQPFSRSTPVDGSIKLVLS